MIGHLVRSGRRALQEQAVGVQLHGVAPQAGPTLIAANHIGRVDRHVVSVVWPTPVLGHTFGLRTGQSALVFPEGGISPDGSLGRFRPEAFGPVRELWANGSSVTITPVALVGSFGLNRQLPWWKAAAEQEQIVVRAGAPIGPTDESADVLAERVRDAVAALLAETTSTWWDQLRRAAPSEAGAPSWRTAWANSARPVLPGQPEPRKIWC